MQNSMLNFACSSFVGRWWMSAFGMLWLVPTATRFTRSGSQVVLADEVEHHRHAGMRERAARMRLDRHAGERERPRIAELAVDHLGAVAAAGGAKETAVGFESVRRGGEAERRELGGDHAALRRAAGVERLGHRAEVLAQARRLRGADAQARAASLRDRGRAASPPRPPHRSRRRSPCCGNPAGSDAAGSLRRPCIRLRRRPGRRVMRSRPLRRSRSASASTGGSAGAVGCVSRP